MPPQQHNQPTPPASGPQHSFTPHAPGYGFGHEVPQQLFQQHPSGQYEVVPPHTATNTPGPGNGGHNPYEFIVNPQKPGRSVSLLGGNALLVRVAIVVGGLVVLMIIAAVLLSALGPKSSTPGLTAIAERQQEIIRIATAASTDAGGEDTKDFAITTQLTVTTSQQQTLAYLQDHGTKLNPKILALDADSTTDTTLQNAKSAGTYDSAVVQNLTSQLQTYEGLLQSTFKQTTSESAKQLLQSDFTTADKLLKQGKSISTSFGN